MVKWVWKVVPMITKTPMTPMTTMILTVLMVLTVLGLSACLRSARENPDQVPGDRAVLSSVASDKVGLLVFRQVNYAGEGRTHLLQIDDQTLGPLDESNFYRVELWPGHYYLNIHLPAVSFLGESRSAMNMGRMLKLESHLAGQMLVYQYLDGGGLQRLDVPPRAIAKDLKGRRLALHLAADEMAHVTRFLDTRYDGPSLFGQPHGHGILSWADGSRYEGSFTYGHLTPDGKFFYPDGRIFMGRLQKGRPGSRGILLSRQERILFAGPFEDEVPHGLGIRAGKEGPEYCTYLHGEDVTKSVAVLAEEAVALQMFYDAWAKEWLAFVQHYDVWPVGKASSVKASAGTQNLWGWSDNNPTVKPEGLSREERLHRTAVHIAAKQRANLKIEQTWCEDELANQRDWCICAPFNPAVVETGACMR